MIGPPGRRALLYRSRGDRPGPLGPLRRGHHLGRAGVLVLEQLAGRLLRQRLQRRLVRASGAGTWRGVARLVARSARAYAPSRCLTFGRDARRFALLRACAFPARTRPSALAVSGGPDSLGLLLLALAAGLARRGAPRRSPRPSDERRGRPLRATNSVRPWASPASCTTWRCRGANFEARARAERRRVLPAGSSPGTPWTTSPRRCC